MGSPLIPSPISSYSLYGQIVFSPFKLIENGLIYTNKETGKQYILLEIL